MSNVPATSGSTGDNTATGIGSTVGASVGALVFGPPGAVVGGLAGGFAENVVGNIIGNLGADGVKRVSHRVGARFRQQSDPHLNSHLQMAFRDALQAAIYDIGGAACFPKLRQRRAVLDPATYPDTPHGQTLWRDQPELGAQICACLQEMAQAVANDQLVPLNPSADQVSALGEHYLLTATPAALNDAFFDDTIAPFLRGYASLLVADRDFERHLRRWLLDRTLAQLGDLLKSQTYEAAWRAFNRRMFEELQAEVHALVQDRVRNDDQQDRLLSQIEQLANVNDQQLSSIAGAQADLLVAVATIAKRQDQQFAVILDRASSDHAAVMQRLREGFGVVLQKLDAISVDTRKSREMLDEIKDKIQPPTSTALFSIPAPPGDFTGRDDEINTLVAALRAARTNGTAAAISGVRGLGGIGKSALALKVVQELRGDFPDAQIMLALRGATDNPTSTTEALRDVLRAFGQEPDPNLTTQQLINAYQSTLHGKRALILADDARDAAHVASLQPPTGCALLITSRKLFRLKGMAEPLELGKLPEPEAIAFVTNRCGRLGALAKQLTTLCGCLPLALRISATFLANSTRPVERYLQQLARERERLLRQRPDDDDLSIEASFNLSYDALSEAAQTLLQQLGVFPASFSRLALEHVPDLPDTAELDDLLDELRMSSLLDYVPGNDRYDLHDLVRVFALARLRDAGDEHPARLRYAAFYAALAAAADQLYLRGNDSIRAGLALFDLERPHIDAAWQWLREQPLDDATDSLLMQYADATAFVGDLRYDKKNERIPQLAVALDAAQRQQDRSAEGRLLGNLGLAYANLGDVRRAIEFYEQHIAIAQEIGDRSGEANSSWNLGALLTQQGETARAMGLMGVLVDFLREIGHPNAEQHAAMVEQMRQQQVQQPLLAFLNAGLLDDMRQVLEAHPTVSTDVVEPLLDAFFEQYKDDPKAIETLTWKRQLLRNCRQHGVQVVFAALDQAPQNMPPEMAQFVQALNH
jgi:tetratricopeptide (TPR) repeat protein